jgi:hypothetical protein
MDGGHGAGAPFAHPTESIFKQRHLQIQLRDPAACLREADPEFPAI